MKYQPMRNTVITLQRTTWAIKSKMYGEKWDCWGAEKEKKKKKKKKKKKEGRVKYKAKQSKTKQKHIDLVIYSYYPIKLQIA